MKPTNARHAEIPALWTQGLKIAEIAERLGLSVAAISDWAYRHRELCPKRQNMLIDRREAVTGVSTIPKRTIMIAVIPNTGVSKALISYTPVSVAAFSWDGVSA